jgi:hypothetical protein
MICHESLYIRRRHTPLPSLSVGKSPAWFDASQAFLWPRLVPPRPGFFYADLNQV